MGEEVAALKADKEELQYILAAHRNTCSLQVKVEPVTEEEPPVCGGPAQRGDSQTPETRLSLPPDDRQQHRGSQHRDSIQRHPQLQHLAGGKDRPDAHQHPEPHQSVGSHQDPLRPEHSQLRESGEKTDSDRPAEPQHSGSPHLTVTPPPPHLPIFYKEYYYIILSSLVAQLSCF